MTTHNHPVSDIVKHQVPKKLCAEAVSVADLKLKFPAGISKKANQKTMAAHTGFACLPKTVATQLTNPVCI